jgi:hypothetical protein
MIKACASGVLKYVLKAVAGDRSSKTQKTKKAAQGRFFRGFQAFSRP